MLRRNAILLFVGLLLIMPIVDCGGTGHHVTSTPAISGTLPNGSVDVAYTGTLTVTGGTAPYTWAITGLPATLTFTSSGNTVTISGTPLATGTITGTATVTDSNMRVSPGFPYTFTIGEPALAITPTTFNLMVGTAASQVLTVNPATIGPYTWTIISGALPPGSPALLLGNGTTTSPNTIQTTTNSVTIAGTPNTAGNFPFIIQVTDSAAPPNSAQASYSGYVSNSNAQACPAGNNNAALAAGTSYAFLLEGFDATDDYPIAIAGSFTVDGNGGITAADVDYNGVTLGPQNPGSSVDLAASTYSFDLNSVNPDTRGCLSLVFSSGGGANRGAGREPLGSAVKRISLRSRRGNSARSAQVPAAPPTPTRVIFQFALGGLAAGVYTTGNIIEFDNGDGQTNSWASGVMHVQTLSPTFTVSSLAPNFAFGVTGWDTTPDRAALAGSFAIAGGTISPIFADFNDNGTPSGEQTGGSGVINAITTATGRATANFDIPITGSPDLKFDAVVYVINADDFYVLSSDAVSTNVPLLSGRGLAAPGTFTAGALNGFSLLASEGFDPVNSTNVVSIGTAQFSSTGTTATASFTQSDNGVVTTPAFTGTYTVDTTNPTSGRVAFTVTTGTAVPPVIYLTSGGDGIEEIQGFSVGTDANVGSGILVTQSTAAPDFTPASVSGTYAFGIWEDVDGQNGSFSGTAILTAPSTYSAVEDETFVTLTAPFLSLGTAVSGGFTIIPAGTGTITVGANTSVFVTNGEQIFSIVPTTNSGPDAILATHTNVVPVE
ncbi:MAG: hypothetical protein ABSB66_07445 [Candidatus Acidiferrales bacterium]|jgi:hypothetical protein